ncbi:MAG: peptidylprolyl isomerase fpr4 [Candelina mexicana]|nr:MAG: peptidylprolyl isomerase fpr4 [Candelina mexicana]
MAAIDPSAPPQADDTANGDVPARATLKLIRQPITDEEDQSEGDSDEEDYLNALLENGNSDDDDEQDDEDDSSEDEEEKNGGPSDPSKSKKARKEAAVEQLKKALEEENEEDEDMDVDAPNGVNGVVSSIKKGKAKATGDEESDDEEGEDLDIEEFVICTLDPTKNYQQTLDVTIGEDERVFFKVSGTHTIYLTGNYVVPAESHNHDDDVDSEDEEYDLSPDEDDLDDEDESDILDALEDPRITEVDSEEDEVAPKLVKADKKADKKVAIKGKNKRAAEESEDDTPNLDEIMAKSLKPADTTTNGEPKLSKKQLKKLKNNAGQAVEAAVENKTAKKEEPTKESPSSAKGDKKVQFAKNLEQGPSGSPKDTKSEQPAAGKNEAKKDDNKPKASLGVKVIQGVKVDDKKLGTGRASKKGDRVGMRYIGKLEDGKVFDSNKKGKPFSFKLGSGEVIKGWDIGVLGMSVGGERRMTIPSHLGYAGKAQPGIPANSTLVFDVKLLEIK